MVRRHRYGETDSVAIGLSSDLLFPADLLHYFLFSKADKALGIDQILVGGFEPVVATSHRGHPHLSDLAAKLRRTVGQPADGHWHLIAL